MKKMNENHQRLVNGGRWGYQCNRCGYWTPGGKTIVAHQSFWGNWFCINKGYHVAWHR